MKKPRIVFLAPELGIAGGFYSTVLKFMTIAAKSLRVELESLNTLTTPDLDAAVARMVSGPDRPDGAVIVNSQKSPMSQLRTFDAAKVHVVLACEGFYDAERPSIGFPGSPCAYWRSEISPDDQQAGRLLAATLIDRATAQNLRGETGKIRMLALSGPSTQAAINRLTGLREAVHKHGSQISYDLKIANWDEKKAHQLTADYLRHTRPQIVWGANDLIATGAALAIEQAGLRQGKDILVGGIDWAQGTLQQVKTGRFATSVGGHVLDGVWALIMLVDAIHGHPPPPQRSLKSSMVAATVENLAQYIQAVDEGHLATIDFGPRFCKPKGDYDFSLERLT
jgi:ABC-type sugar transport system substrate-binding protein